jgi:hypothetical protein
VKSQIRNLRLALSLFVLRIRADHAHHAFAVNDLAVVAHLFNGSPYFHNRPPFPPEFPASTQTGAKA